MKYEYSEENLARIKKVADSLMGTCNSVDSAVEDEFGDETDLGDIDQLLLQELDDMVTLCEACGWWNETSFTEDGLCDDCVDGEEDEN